MKFEEYCTRTEFQELAKDTEKRRSGGEKLLLFVGLPLFLIAAILCGICEIFELFEKNLALSIITCAVGVAAIVISFVGSILVRSQSGMADFNGKFFQAEKLFAEEKLSVFFEQLPKEGTATVYFDWLSEENKLQLSLDGQTWQSYDTSLFCDCLRASDFCAMLCIAYFSLMERNQMRGFMHERFALKEVIVDEAKRGKPSRKKVGQDMREEQDGVLRLVNRGKLTLAGKSAYKRWKKLNG